MSLNRQTQQQIKSEQTKKNLIEAASELFMQYPIDQVGVRDIAKKANVTTGTFYYHFKSKNDILDHLYNASDKGFKNIFKDGLFEKSYYGKIVEFFSLILARKVEKEGVDFTWHRIMEMRNHSTEKSELYIGMIDLIRKAQESKELNKEFNPEEINNFFFLVFRGVLYEWCIACGDFELSKEIEKGIKHAIRSFA